MSNLKCWPGAVCQITRVQRGTDEEQLLGRLVKVLHVEGACAVGPLWRLEKPEPMNITVPCVSGYNGSVMLPGDICMVTSLPDVYLTPFKPLSEPEEELDESELDIEHSFTAPVEPEHA